MTSKYGMQLYGRDLYSDAHLNLEGTPLPISTGMSARFGRNRLAISNLNVLVGLNGIIAESESFIASMAIATTMSGRVYKGRILQGTFSVAPTYNATLYDNNGFRGVLSVVPTYNAILSRPSPQKLEGHIDIPVTYFSRPEVFRSLQGTNLQVVVSIDPADDVYIGPFWKPDVPEDGSWAPIPEEGGPWVPID